MSAWFIVLTLLCIWRFMVAHTTQEISAANYVIGLYCGASVLLAIIG